MASIGIEIDKEKLREFCQRWQITEFFFFGSVLREDFRWDSDVDVLVTFAPETRWTLFDIVHMQDELAEIFDRSVDLGEKRAIESGRNPLRREAILSTLVALEDIDSFVPRTGPRIDRAEHALYDVLLSARSVIQYARNMTRQEWAHDAKTREASLFRLSTIGRAMRHVDTATRASFPNVSWDSLARLEELTDYRYVPDRVAEIWAVITEALPTVVAALEPHFSETAA